MDDKCRDNSEVKYSFFVNESISIIVKNILAIDSAIPHCLLPPPHLPQLPPPPYPFVPQVVDYRIQL